MTEDEEMTYAEAGVDIEESEAAVGALVGAMTDVEDTTAYAGLIDIGDRYLAMTTDGVGTKLLVAEALQDYSTIGIDCIAMNVNDLVAAGVTPVAFVDYLAVEEPAETMSAEIGNGLAEGASRGGVSLVGGETAVLPEVISGFDLAGAAAGLATPDQLLDGEAQVGDKLVGIPSSGVHSNGLTLARKAATTDHEYNDPLPGEDRTIGEALLEPTRIYTYLLDSIHAHDVHAAAHVTGGGWTNLFRMGEFGYEITDPHPVQPVFEFIQDAGNVSDEEMHRTFNMGTGFVVAVDPADAEAFVAETDGQIIGDVTEGSTVEIRGCRFDPE
ncbi:phosphoribosylformylglycinamidine cyclo-ligase [Halodesulfurarchaeum formicicum]|uniref:Phosphoribosylformylglycinamidine cyclo-ligase n=1 Tax=Halodesulfurarchaeum formicicum TaxID=1873524 RepID=A0A1J1ABZ7_9EURY|nr:phosphoribosylformylglycinamidine cyclo-ligase [Halodesulfurarchaeum formicicum]APE95307.1 phosphoribosylaminoimidazole synthetase [Halodesulfurarchaeum formicicum]